MFRLILVSAFVVLTFAAQKNVRKAPMLDSRSIERDLVDITEHPYAVSLYYIGSFICGGSLVNPTQVVTAAHCIDGFSASALIVRYGSSFHNQGGTVVQVSSFNQNPSYNSRTLDYDSSVLTLAEAVDFTPDTQNPIALVDTDPADGEYAISIGWETTSEVNSTQLSAIDIPIVNWQECRDAHIALGFEFTDRMICAGEAFRGPPCQGGAGGPLSVNGYLVGIVSWGVCSRPEYPSVFGSIASMKSWLDSAIDG